MKSSRIYILSLALVFALASCMGPTGPSGRDGSNSSADGFADIRTDEFTIKPNAWIRDINQINKWVYKQSIPNITSSIELNGFVLIYMKAGNNQSWTSLPYTFLDRDTKGNFYSTEYAAWWSVGQVEIQFIDTHPTSPLPPDMPTYIKVVSAKDVAPYLMPKYNNYTNYEKTKVILNLKD